MSPGSEPSPIEADPHPFPRSGPLDPVRTALVVIDMQADFCSPGGYLSALGYDVEPRCVMARWLEAPPHSPESGS